LIVAPLGVASTSCCRPVAATGSLTQVADDLRSRAGEDPAEALRLGYLVGAVRRGAALTPGLAAQLARRVEQSANPEIEARRPRAELARGIGLGEAGG